MGTPGSGPQRGQPRRAMFAAAASSTLGFLPVFLVAAQGVLLRSELGFNEAHLGIAVSVFFGAGAVFSAPAGRLSERLGPKIGMLTAATGTATVLVLIATTTQRWAHLVILLAISGAVNAVAQTSADLSVARGVPERIQGFAFGVKTSCVPLATLFSGVAIPAIGVHFGWRMSFVVAAGVAVALAVLAPRSTSFAAPRRGRDGAGPTATRALVVLAVTGALSIGAVNTMGAFYVESAMRLDLSPSGAGWWLALGSLAAVAARVGFGAHGDRIDRGHLIVVAWLWVAGGTGLLLLAPASSAVLFAVGTLIAFTAGSGWTGLFLTAVVRSNPAAPAAATGIVMTGQLGGSVIGPLAFGAAANGGSYAGAWVGTAAALLLAAALMPVAQRMLAVAPQPRVRALHEGGQR